MTDTEQKQTKTFTVEIKQSGEIKVVDLKNIASADEINGIILRLATQVKQQLRV